MEESGSAKFSINGLTWFQYAPCNNVAFKLFNLTTINWLLTYDGQPHDPLVVHGLNALSVSMAILKPDKKMY